MRDARPDDESVAAGRAREQNGVVTGAAVAGVTGEIGWRVDRNRVVSTRGIDLLKRGRELDEVDTFGALDGHGRGRAVGREVLVIVDADAGEVVRAEAAIIDVIIDGDGAVFGNPEVGRVDVVALNRRAGRAEQINAGVGFTSAIVRVAGNLQADSAKDQEPNWRDI